ncbi:MAG: hypothetical protein KA498_07340 [Neisseriaceae bacterium]|nr:hypothetical protein [Neisseriaceae bacterium]
MTFPFVDGLKLCISKRSFVRHVCHHNHNTNHFATNPYSPFNVLNQYQTHKTTFDTQATSRPTPIAFKRLDDCYWVHPAPLKTTEAPPCRLNILLLILRNLPFLTYLLPLHDPAFKSAAHKKPRRA